MKSGSTNLSWCTTPGLHSEGIFGAPEQVGGRVVAASGVADSISALIGVLAAYPWSGHQFLDPRVGTAEVRVLMGDADEWCSPMQAQGHCQAIRIAGGNANMRLFAGAQHSFDCRPPVTLEASMPTLKMRRDGSHAWLLADAVSGADVGGISYVHSGDGRHYRPWLLVDGVAREFGERLPQLAMAARAIEHEVARARGRKA